MFGCRCLKLSYHGVGRCRMFLMALIFPWWIARSFLFGSNVPLVFQLSWGSTFGCWFIQHRPSHVVACFDGLEPSQFYWVTTYGMDPFDGLFGRREIIDTVGLLECFPCLFGWTPRLPPSPLLHQRYLVFSMTISNSDEDGFTFACNEDVFFFEYIDAVFCAD
jgi:hypothetical protein